MAAFRFDWPAHLTSLNREMERLLEHLGGSKPPSARFCPTVLQPAVDIYETGDEVVVVMELAGIQEEDIELTVDRNTLVIRGQRQEPRSGPPRLYHHMEICYGPFQRELLLPSLVDAEAARVSYRDGMLEITLPKALQARTRHIPVKTR